MARPPGPDGATAEANGRGGHTLSGTALVQYFAVFSQSESNDSGDFEKQAVLVKLNP